MQVLFFLFVKVLWDICLPPNTMEESGTFKHNIHIGAFEWILTVYTRVGGLICVLVLWAPITVNYLICIECGRGWIHSYLKLFLK